MNSTQKILGRCLVVLAAMSAPSAFGQSGTWNATVGGNWGTASNWNPVAVPGNLAGDIVGLNNNITGAANVNLQTGNRTVGILNIGDSNSSHAFTLSSGGAFLTLNNSGSNAQVNQSSTLSDTISAPMILADSLSSSVTGSLTISGNISETGGARGITKTGAGTLFLSGANSYTGNTTISAGPVSISSNNALGTTAGITSFTANGSATGARVLMTGSITSGEHFTIAGATEASGFAAALFSQSGSNTLTGNVTLSSPTGGIRLGAAGGATLNLNGFITQTGNTTAQLALQAQGAGSTVFVANPISNNGGGLNVFGLSGSAGGVVELLAASGSGIGNTVIQQRGTLTLRVADALNTSGNVTLGAGGSTSGQDIGTLDIRRFDQTIGALIGNINSSNSASSANRIVTSLATTSGNHTLTVGSGNASGTFNGVILNGTLVNLAFTKTGTGTQTFAGNGTYTYSGATNVNAGTLAVIDSVNMNATSAINVAGGAKFAYNSSTALTVAPTLNGSLGSRATLGGNGTINAALTLNSVDDVLSPGNSPGILGFGTDQPWNSYTYEWELNDWSASVAGTNIDQIAITGNLTLTGTTGSYVVDVLSLTAGNVPGNVPGFSETNNTWTILTTTTGISGFNAAHWTVNTAGFSSSPTAGGSWNVAQSGNNLILNYVAVPEPATFAMLGCGAIALAVVRRSRSQNSHRGSQKRNS